MKREKKEKIKKYAWAILPIMIVLTFVITYATCTMIEKVLGVTPAIAQTISTDIGGLSAIGIYIVLSIWGLKNL